MAVSKNCQLLHWVIRVGNLKKTLEFLCGGLGMKVLRHEEFKSECEAQCNGPFSRPWSKTMVGYNHEDTGFVLELAFNYGITQYEKGNDLRYIQVQGKGLNQLLQNQKYQKNKDGYLISPDGYPFKLVESDQDREIMGVSLNTDDLGSIVSYYQDVLCMEVLDKVNDSVRLGYRGNNFLHFVEFNLIDDKVIHAKAGGRLAIAVTPTELIAKDFKDRVIKSNHKIHTDIVELPTEGKATVVVLILLDPVGNEICLVGGEAFYELSKYVEGNQTIDFQHRIVSGSKE